eukprot:1865208-Prorocentrum_lima.AAC.1
MSRRWARPPRKRPRPRALCEAALPLLEVLPALRPQELLHPLQLCLDDRPLQQALAEVEELDPAYD